MAFTSKDHPKLRLVIVPVLTIPGIWLTVFAFSKNPGLEHAFVQIYGACLLLFALALPFLFTRKHRLCFLRTLPSRDIRGEALAISVSMATGSTGGFWLTSHSALIRLVGSSGAAIEVLLIAWLCFFGFTFFLYRLTAFVVTRWLSYRSLPRQHQ